MAARMRTFAAAGDSPEAAPYRRGLPRRDTWTHLPPVPPIIGPPAPSAQFSRCPTGLHRVYSTLPVGFALVPSRTRRPGAGFIGGLRSQAQQGILGTPDDADRFAQLGLWIRRVPGRPRRGPRQTPRHRAEVPAANPATSRRFPA